MRSLLFNWDKESESQNLCNINRIRKIQFESWILLDANYKRFFNPKYNLTLPFLKDLEFRSKGENHFIIEVLGETGSGKSAGAFVIFLKVLGYERFTIEHISFERRVLIDKVKKDFNKNDGHVLDEQTVGVGVGSDRELLEQQNLEEITRKAGLNIGFCSPTERTHGTAHYKLLYIKKDISKDKRITFFGILRNMGNMKYLPIGYVGIRIPPEKEKEKLTKWGEFWKEYNKRKDQFIIKMLKQEELQRLDHKEMAQKILQHSHFRKGQKNVYYHYLASELYPTKTSQEIKNIVMALRIYYKEQLRGRETKEGTIIEKKGIYCAECNSGENILFDKEKGVRFCNKCGSREIIISKI